MRSDFTILPKLNDDERVTPKTLNERIKVLNSWRIDGLPKHRKSVYPPFCFHRISDRLYRLLGAKVWQTDKYRSDKRQCSGQNPRRVIAWGYSYIILVTMWCVLKMYHHIHLKVPRTVPHTATGSLYDWGVITYLFLCPQKTELRMRTELISMAEYRVCDETIWQGMTPMVSAIEVWKSLPYLAVRNKETSVIN